MMGRTSIEPVRDPGMPAARAMASSRSLASTRKKPPSCSRVSAKGPSVVKVFPFFTRTVVAVETGCSASPPM